MRKNIFLFSITIIITIIFLEYFLRIFYPQNLTGWYAERDHSGINILKNNINYFHRINNRNIRYTFGNFHNRDTDTINLNKKKILVLGDSFTFGWLINDEDTYIHLLQKKFDDYYFINSSVPGWGLADQVRYIENYCKEINPEKVIIMLNTDDIVRAWLSSTYKVQIKDLKNYKNNILIEGKANPLNYNSSFHQIPFYKFFIKNSHLMVFTRQIIIDFKNGKLILNNKVKTKDYVNEKFDIPSQSLGKENNKSIILAKLLYLRLKKLIEDCDSKLIIIYSGWYNYNLNDKNPTLIFLKEAKIFFENHNIKYYDLTEEMKDVHYNYNNYLIPHDGHPNEKGHKIIAEKIIENIKLN